MTVLAINLHSWHELAQQVVNWLPLGSIYALLAIGIAAVFAVVGLINFAHGEVLLMSGIAMLLLSFEGVPWEAIVPLAILAGMGTAILMELIAFRPVRNAPPLTLLLTSLGLSLIIQNGVRLWRGPRSEAIQIPDLTSASFHVGSVMIAWIDLATILTTMTALLLLNLFLRKSVRGLAMRASSEDFTMTRLMGIRADTVIMASFAVSGLLAGLAAFFYFGGTTGQVGLRLRLQPAAEGLHRRRDRRSRQPERRGARRLHPRLPRGLLPDRRCPPENTPFSVAIVFGDRDPRAPVPPAGHPRRPRRRRGARMSSRRGDVAASSAAPRSGGSTELWFVRGVGRGRRHLGRVRAL